LRHRRENLKKCSLRGLEGRSDLLFFSYPNAAPLPDLSAYLLLKIGAPLLEPSDKGRGILLLDGTWRLTAIMERTLPWKLAARSLPAHYKTAYPRCQTHCPNPSQGLASIEALFLAYLMLERPTEGLLDHYYWKGEFLHNTIC
jgi:pre-rRNA-processing protein TSR3